MITPRDITHLAGNAIGGNRISAILPDVPDTVGIGFGETCFKRFCRPILTVNIALKNKKRTNLIPSHQQNKTGHADATCLDARLTEHKDSVLVSIGHHKGRSMLNINGL